MENIKVAKHEDELISLFKGVEPFMLKNLSPKKRIDLRSITLKELMIIAESGREKASLQFKDILNNKNDELSNSQLLKLNSLVEFGEKLSDLNPNLRKEVIKNEIQEEMNHFSRIMGLDKIISNSRLLPLSTNEAFSQCKDFARLMWLVFERRNQKLKTDYKLVTFPATVDIKIQGGISLLSQNNENNFSVLLFTKKNLSNVQESEFLKVTEVFGKFLSLYSPEMTISLLDYFLFLTESKLGLGVVSAQEISSNNGESEIKIVGTCGFSLALTTNTDNFNNSIVYKTAFNDKDNQFLGSMKSVIIFKKTFSLPSKASSVFLFPSDSALNELSNRQLIKVANQKDKQGKIILTNNYKKFVQKSELNNLFGVIKSGNKQVTKSSIGQSQNIPVKISIPANLISAQKIVFETAHIHADREPTQTQFDTIYLRKRMINNLKESGFKGKVEDILMIDDYHVVNRLDYKKYLTRLKKNGFVPDYVVLESSPVVRAIAIDILKRLFKELPKNISLQGNNLYLKINNNKVIELVEGLAEKDIIGCVLFDAAFSLFKKDIKATNSMYKKLINDKNIAKNDAYILQFYFKEIDPIKRREFINNLLFPIPNLYNLKKGNNVTPFLNSLENVNAQVVNIHEIFYQPQQATVNTLLALMGLSPITSAYINPLSQNDVLIECSALFG